MYSWAQMRTWLSVLSRYVIGAAIVVWLIKSDQIDLNKISEIDIKTTTIALFLSFTPLVLTTWRLRLLLKAHQINVPFGHCIAYNAIGIFYSTILPGGMSGDAVRAYYFWRCSYTQNRSKAELIAVLINDRLIGTVTMLLIGIIAATVSMKALDLSFLFIFISWLVFLVGIAVYLFCFSFPASKWPMKDSLRKRPIFSSFERLMAKMDLRKYSLKNLSFAGILSGIGYVSGVFVIYIFSIRLSSGLDFGQVMAIVPVGLLANSIPISPGGLGVGEKSFDVLYGLAGGHHGGTVFMLSRIFLFSPALLGALIAIGALLRKKIRRESLT
ncbi:MAG: lysylphosphatidylglycerol synthase transmembrane domain-containing protein [Burkholderiales bacterium]|nr:lysylphosphatidylglycerol synthase transmembrane domain-containing protein [Burkholderiales bacterium]